VTSPARQRLTTRLAVWANAWALGAVSLDEVVSRCRAGDPPHVVSGPDGDSEPVIVAFRRLFEGQIALAVLPAPGFLLGLAGPESFNRAALEAGGAVLAGDIGLIARVDDSEVVWETHDITPTHHFETLREAGFELRRTLTETADTFATADLRAARESLLDDLLAIEEPVPVPLPTTFDDADERAVGTALRCLQLTAGALEDHGVDLSASSSHIRTSTLRTLDQAARRVLIAASAHRPRR